MITRLPHGKVEDDRTMTDMKIYRSVSAYEAATIIYRRADEVVHDVAHARGFAMAAVVTRRMKDGAWGVPYVTRLDRSTDGAVLIDDEVVAGEVADMTAELVRMGLTDYAPFSDFAWASKHPPCPGVMALSEMDCASLSGEELHEVMRHVVPPCFRIERDEGRHEVLYREWLSGYDDPSTADAAREELRREAESSPDLSVGRASELVATIAGAVFRKWYFDRVTGMQRSHPSSAFSCG
jgi:hypothetical protein